MQKKLMVWLFYTAIAFSTIVAEELPWIKDGKPGLELEIVHPFLPENPVILEAGGHYGEDTVLIVKKWPESTVYSFEPCPSYYSKLEKAVAHLHNVYIFPFGLFSTTGFYTFHVSKNWDGASSLLQDNHLPVAIYDDYQISVFCQNLDEWAEQTHLDHIDYMWLDIEGAELEVLNSAPKILQTVRAISCELNYREFRKGMPHFQVVVDFLKSQGFTLYKIWGLQGGDPGTWQSTGVFIRSSLIKPS